MKCDSHGANAKSQNWLVVLRRVYCPNTYIPPCWVCDISFCRSHFVLSRLEVIIHAKASLTKSSVPIKYSNQYLSIINNAPNRLLSNANSAVGIPNAKNAQNTILKKLISFASSSDRETALWNIPLYETGHCLGSTDAVNAEMLKPKLNRNSGEWPYTCKSIIYVKVLGNYEQYTFMTKRRRRASIWIMAMAIICVGGFKDKSVNASNDANMSLQFNKNDQKPDEIDKSFSRLISDRFQHQCVYLFAIRTQENSRSNEMHCILIAPMTTCMHHALKAHFSLQCPEQRIAERKWKSV